MVELQSLCVANEALSGFQGLSKYTNNKVVAAENDGDEAEHYLGDMQWDYIKELILKYSGLNAKDMKRFYSYLETNEEINNDAGSRRGRGILGEEDCYRNTNYARKVDETWKVEYDPFS